MAPPPKHKNKLTAPLSGAFQTLGNKILSVPSRLNPMRNRNSGTRVATAPGIEHETGVDTPPEPNSVTLSCIDYDKTNHQATTFQTVQELIAFPRPEWGGKRWINVEGLHPYVINELRKVYNFHTLAAEDIVHIPQRPKFEQYDEHCLIVLDMARIIKDELVSEQVSFIVLDDVVITFQEKRGDVWDPIRMRIQNLNSRFRRYSVWYLAYALLDAIVDNIFPILERYGDVLTDLEEQALLDPKESIQQHIYIIKRELYSLRRSFWPVRELSNKLAFDEMIPVDKKVRLYLRDVHDHSTQIIELIENSREMANSLQDFYISVTSNRMNEVMKALTIMASLFLPITFFAGVYGMNFDHIPELHWAYSYPVFWGLCISCTTGLLWYFKKKGWIGK